MHSTVLKLKDAIILSIRETKKPRLVETLDLQQNLLPIIIALHNIVASIKHSDMILISVLDLGMRSKT